MPSDSALTNSGTHCKHLPLQCSKPVRDIQLSILIVHILGTILTLKARKQLGTGDQSYKRWNHKLRTFLKMWVVSKMKVPVWYLSIFGAVLQFVTRRGSTF